MNIKKNLLLLVCLLAAVFTACKSDIPATGELQADEISVTLSASARLRSTNRPEAEGHHLRYVLEVYKDDGNNNPAERVVRMEQLSPAFTVKIAANESYTLLAWADFVSNGEENASAQKTEDEYYITDPLTNVRLKTDGYTLNNRGRDAFSANAKAVTAQQKNVNMTLRRPFALMNLKEKNSSAKSVKITYPAVYTAFNVQTGSVTGAPAALTATAAVLPQNSENVLAFDYLFARPLQDGFSPQKGSSLYDLKVEASNQSEFADPYGSFELQYVPFTQNYRTNIEGAFHLGSVDGGVNISIDDEFNLPDIAGNKPFIVSSYIRSSFFQNFNRIPQESMLANNDLIYHVGGPYTDGTLFFELPENNASFTNTTYLNTFNGRKGVMQFNGTGANMNGGADLLHLPRVAGGKDGSFRQFTFGTWLYVDEWTPGSHLFRKENNASRLVCKMGGETSQLVFEIGDKSIAIAAPELTVGAWHHVALAYHGGKDENNRIAVYINGNAVSGIVTPADFPTAVPFMRTLFHIGTDFKGKMDETFVSGLQLSAVGVKNYANNGIQLRNTDWNSVKTLAYWKFDDASNPGKDAQSWKSIYNEVREKIAGKNIKLRLGLIDGDWKTVIANPAYRTNFVNSVYNEVVKNKWDGVDLDFEWIYNGGDYSAYNATIIELGNKLKPLGVTFSVSLHPVAYQISMEAVAAVDFVSLQIYGPSPEIFSLQRFKDEIQNVLNYGFPKEKLVVGVPFYGAESNNQRATAAYIDFVNAGLITSPDLDQVTHNGKTYTFNGQTTMRAKTTHIRSNQLAGIMSWDIATDVSINDTRSLLRAVKEELAR